MEKSFESLLRKRLADMENTVYNALVSGNIEDYAKYREVRGKMLMIHAVKAEVDELVRIYKEEGREGGFSDVE